MMMMMMMTSVKHFVPCPLAGDAFGMCPIERINELHGPTAIQCVTVEPGEFIRYGMGVAVHAVWLAYLLAQPEAIFGTAPGEEVDDATI